MGAEQIAAPTRFASYEEAGKRYGVSRWTLWRWARDGHIRIARVGRITRVDCQSVEDFLAERAGEIA